MPLLLPSRKQNNKHFEIMNNKQQTYQLILNNYLYDTTFVFSRFFSKYEHINIKNHDVLIPKHNCVAVMTQLANLCINNFHANDFGTHATPFKYYVDFCICCTNQTQVCEYFHANLPPQCKIIQNIIKSNIF